LWWPLSKNIFFTIIFWLSLTFILWLSISFSKPASSIPVTAEGRENWPTEAIIASQHNMQVFGYWTTNFVGCLPLAAVHHFCLTKGFPKNSQLQRHLADRSTIWQYFTLIRLCLAFLFIISIQFFSLISGELSTFWFQRLDFENFV
jgi:hypothetical protein